VFRPSSTPFFHDFKNSIQPQTDRRIQRHMVWGHMWLHRGARKTLQKHVVEFLCNFRALSKPHILLSNRSVCGYARFPQCAVMSLYPGSEDAKFFHAEVKG
jgi:hypothetical protein